jgi:ribosome-binding protein aMBF1 (putative translation factor)
MVKYPMKCEICGAEIKRGIMDKVRGTYIRRGKKLVPICPNCQKEGEASIKEKMSGKI